MPSINTPLEKNEELADQEKKIKKKIKLKEYGDAKRHAKEINIQPGDEMFTKSLNGKEPR